MLAPGLAKGLHFADNATCSMPVYCNSFSPFDPPRKSRGFASHLGMGLLPLSNVALEGLVLV